MDKIQLLYVENVLHKEHKTLQQTLNFFILVESRHYEKQIDVVWSGDDGIWHSSPVYFHSRLDQTKEYWQLKITKQLSQETPFPKNILFGLRLQSAGKEYWDNNQGLNYYSPVNSGVRLAHTIPILNIGFETRLKAGQKFMPIVVAVDPALAVDKVIVHWTTDNWLHTHQTPCHFRKSRHNSKLSRRPQSPNLTQAELWKGRIKLNNVFRLQYCVACYKNDQLWWDNNFTLNYITQHKSLNVMILNLHCYQEDHQDHKFSQIAKAIDDLDVDIVCLQEVAEFWNDGYGDWNSNSAKIINDRLKTPFHIYTDWSHLGFDKYREGVAILSRYPMSNHESRYVSDAKDVYSIHSRKVIMAKIQIPGIGLINVFSAHLSWWEDGFEDQFKHLSAWAADRSSKTVKATFLCGDFNIAAGSKGYELVVNTNEYEDQFLAINAHGVFEKVFRVNDPHWRHYLADDYRIDYIFLNKASRLKAVAGEVLFTDHYYGRVSDHCGYLMAFEPT